MSYHQKPSPLTAYFLRMPGTIFLLHVRGVVCPAEINMLDCKT
jgi:hypothetical protein